MQQENKKWYAVEHDGYWGICDAPLWEDHKDVLAAIHVGEEQAEENAKLCASAPEIRELLDDMYSSLEAFAEIHQLDADHPVIQLMNRYENLIVNEKNRD